MAMASIAAGVALVVLGGLVTLASDSGSATSLIPAVIGVLFLALGGAAHAKPALNHHLMHGAAALSLLAILGSVGSIVGRGSSGWALFAQVATAAIAGVFLVLAIQTFRAARLARDAEAA